MTGSPIAIIVDADAAELRRSGEALEAAGFVVMTADSFAQARTLLSSMTPEIVIADIKLQAFNGLHLAALCATWRPGTPFIATHVSYDMVLEAEARRLSAVYVVKTQARSELTEAAATLLNSRPRSAGVRGSYRKTAPPQTVVEVASSSAEIVDVSYGGVRLKVPSPPSGPSQTVPVSFDIVFPQLDLSLRAARIWTSPDSSGSGWLCGADVSENESHELERWRDFVDSVI